MRRAGPSFAALAAGLLLIATSIAIPSKAASQGRRADQVQAREIFFGDSAETACQPGGREFWLEDLGDLHVCIVLRGVKETHVARLTVRSPDGHVYQTLTVPFVTAGAPATVETVEVEGRPHRVTRAGWRFRGEAVILGTIPVAGTFITQYHLVGLWTVEVSLDGQPLDRGQFELLARE